MHGHDLEVVDNQVFEVVKKGFVSWSSFVELLMALIGIRKRDDQPGNLESRWYSSIASALPWTELEKRRSIVAIISERIIAGVRVVSLMVPVTYSKFALWPKFGQEKSCVFTFSIQYGPELQRIRKL